MGQEISRIHFSREDFSRFEQRLAEETDLLGQLLQSGGFSATGYVGGFELEAWLVDRNYFPSPNNESYLARLASPLVVPELSKFNIELNGTPQRLAGNALSALEKELTATWRQCLKAANDVENSLILIGILPTVREEDLSIDNISPLNRYYALNEQILLRRGGQPLHVAITGLDQLELLHRDVMLEAATTSFQVHLQIPANGAVRYFNASQILAAPMVAVSANSPFLFERELWDETRIPLFEQAVDSGGERRVTFGKRYLEQSPLEYFIENQLSFPVLLPIAFESEAGDFDHLRLHNGTIWRWNRLLIGKDSDSTPHLRIEHRVMPAGPSVLDMIANTALYLGAVRFLAGLHRPPEEQLDFATARVNFYRSAQQGLDAEVAWLGGRSVGMRELLLEEILPMATEGLKLLGVDEDDAERYLSVIFHRVHSGQNGAVWQKRYVSQHGRDFFQLTAAYLERQRSGVPVHEWGM